MKKPLAILLIFFHILPSIPFAQQAPSIAVIEFEAKGISQIEASALTDELEINLSDIGGYTVVERGRVGEILNEQAFQQTGCVSSECAVEIGKLLSVQNIVLGSISKVGSTFSVNAKIVDVKSGEILKTANYKHRGLIDDLLTNGMAEVVAQLIGDELSIKPVATIPQPEVPLSVPYVKGKIMFRILDVYAAEVSNATVKIENLEFLSVGGKTEEIELPFGSWDWVAEKSGYKPSQGTVKVVSEETEEINVYLYPDRSILSQNPSERNIAETTPARSLFTQNKDEEKYFYFELIGISQSIEVGIDIWTPQALNGFYTRIGKLQGKVWGYVFNSSGLSELEGFDGYALGYFSPRENFNFNFWYYPRQKGLDLIGSWDTIDGYRELQNSIIELSVETKPKWMSFLVGYKFELGYRTWEIYGQRNLTSVFLSLQLSLLGGGF